MLSIELQNLFIMAEHRIIDKTLITRVLINRLKENEEPREIKAKHIQEFENPDKITVEGKTAAIVPDLIAIYEKKTQIYQIQLGKDLPIESWEILALYAKENNGNFYLVVPDVIKEQVKKKIIKNHINAGIIYFQTN